MSGKKRKEMVPVIVVILLIVLVGCVEIGRASCRERV